MPTDNDSVSKNSESIDSQKNTDTSREVVTTEDNEENSTSENQVESTTSTPPNIQVPIESVNAEQTDFSHVLIPSEEDLSGFTNNSSISNSQPEIKNTHNKKRVVAFGLIIGLVIFLLSVPAFGVMAAYGKIPLKEETRFAIQKIVFSLPFFPPTKEYVLASSSIAHKEVSTMYLNASAAITIPGFSQLSGSGFEGFITGGDTLEMKMTGPVDISDPENPKMLLNINLANQLDMDIQSADERIYFRVKKIPTILTSYLSFSSGTTNLLDPLLNKWVMVDQTSLQSDAKGVLDENKQKSPLNTEYEIAIQKLTEEKILPQITMTKEDFENGKAYKFHLEVTEDLINDVYNELEKLEGNFSVLGYSTTNTPLVYTEKPSDYIETFTVDFWIDAETYYFRKGSAYIRSTDKKAKENYSNAPTPEYIDMAFSASISQIGDQFTFTEPESYLTTEEFAAELGRIFQTMQGSGNTIIPLPPL